MVTEEVRKRVLKILKLSVKKRVEELHKIGAEFEKNKDIQLLIDSYIFSFKSHKNRLEVSELIDKIESYKDDVKDEVLFMILLGRLNRDQKQYEKAEAYFKLAIEKDKDEAVVYNDLGILYYDQKEYEKAEESYKLAIEKDKDYAVVYNNLGVLYYDQKEYEKAEECYRLVIEEDKDDAGVYNNLGVLYYDQKEYEKAEECYKKAIKKDENLASAYNGLGILYKAQKQYGKAEEYFKLAIKKDEHYFLAYRNLGNLYKIRGNLELSEQMFKSAKKISSNEKSKLKTSLIDLEIEKLEAIKIRERKEEGEKKSDFIMKTSHLFRSIDQRKREFNKFITDDKRNEKLLKLEVLRRWNSYTPIIANNFHVSKGGGYFLNLNGHGCVVDPGFNFIDNFKGSGKCFKMIDSVIVSHAHNDHESDLESILTLLYKYNEEVKCLDFHDADDDFDESKYKGTIRYDIAERENISIKDVREEDIEKEFLVSSRRKTIDLYIPESVYKKYQGMLDLYGNNNYKFIRIKKNQSETINGFEVHFMWAKHRDIISSEHSLGFYLVHEKNALIYTGDTGWTKEVEEHYRKIKQQLKDKEIILIAHLGGFKDKEENFMYKNSDEEKCTYGNHLGRLGLVGINEVLEPKLCIVSEFGEEFKGSRIKICEILNELFKTTHFLPADIGLNYNFKNNMVKAIFKMDTYRDIIEENHYKEIPFENVSPILLRADYSLHYYDKNGDVIPDELTQALTKEYYTSPR